MKTMALTIALFAATTAPAATLSYSGTFQSDEQTETILVTVPVNSLVDIRTWSYAGGTDGNGSLIDAGGFDPYLSLFQASGSQLLLAVNEDLPSTCGVDSPGDPVTGFCFDAAFSIQLTPGSYFLVISQSGNFPNGPTYPDGFLMTGAGNYTGGPFLDIAGNERTGNWALDVLVSPTEVPEPSSFALVLAGAAAGFCLSRKQRSSARQ